MASPLDALQTRIGPAPAWVWLAGGGVAVYLATKSGLLRGLTGATGATGQSGVIGRSGPAGPPGPTAPPPSPPTPTAPSVPIPVWRFGGPDRGRPYIWRTTGTATPAGINPGQIFPGSGGDPSSNPGAFPGFGAFSWQWAPVPSGTDPQGQAWTDVSYAGALLAAAQQGQNIGGAEDGVGGPRVAGSAPRRRQDVHWAWGGHRSVEHPAPHFVVAPVGGASMHAVARSAGLNPARVMALNPRFHGPRGGGDGADESMGGFSDYQSQPMAGQGPAFGPGRRDLPFNRAGGFSDYQSQPMAGQGPAFGPGRRDRPFTRAGGGEDGEGGPARGLRRFLPGRVRYGNDQTTNYRGVGGAQGSGEELGGAQGASVFAVDPSLNYRTPQVPAGHVARAGQLIRVR